MAPPPNPGNASNKNDDDPLGGMDPMAWLESLAARQGANPDELVTAANLDIPVPPADTIIDEPGYTPGYESSKPAAKAPEPVKAAPPPPPPPSPEPQPVMASVDDPLGGMDPMAWLESLAARQGANPDELVTAANLDIPVPPAGTVIDEPGYTPGYESSKPAAKAPEPEPYEPLAVTPPPEPQPAMASVDDPLGGMDPMAWLESLAARQGANPDELVTAANLDIPIPPADTVIDEPGYVDFDVVSGATRPMEVSTAPEPVNAAPPTPEPVASISADNPLGGMDPLAWLEALAARQGANKEELITGGTAEIPAVDASAVVSDSEYRDYSPFNDQELITPEPSMSADEAANFLGIDTRPQPSVPVSSKLPLEADDPLAFLHNLAATQEPVASSSPTDYRQPSAVPESDTMGAESALSWLEALASGGETQPMAPLTFETPSTPPATPEPVAESGGMSNNLDEVQAWLNAQAQSLAQTRDALDAADQQAELPPAEAAELPDWLRQSMPQTPLTPVKPALTDEIIVPVNPEELPPWLTQPEQAASADLEQDLLAAMQSVAPPPPSTPSAPPPAPEIIPADVGSLSMPGSPEEIDQWAVALDEEYERRRAGDESVPEWYLEALNRAGETITTYEEPVVTSGVEVVSGAPEPVIELPPTQPPREPEAEQPPIPPQTGPLEMPDWLTAEIEEPAAEIEQGDIPDWLRTMAPQVETAPQPTAPKPDWLSGLDAADLGEIPDWLEQTSPKRPEGMPKLPTLEPVTPPSPPPPAKPVEPAPVAQKPPEPVRPTPPPPAKPVVPAVPIEPVGDHAERLKRARALVAIEQHQESLEHYQALIDASAHLEETRSDLRALAEKQPKNPRVRRLLGDTHMRLGDLQAALDTYRSALDQL